MTKTKKHLARLLFFVGFALLALFAGAKLHEFVLSRAAIRHFEEVKHSPGNTPAETNINVPLTVSAPDFLSWSERRIQQYENSLSRQIAPPLAIIRINSVHLEAPVLEGTDDLTLNRGVGHITGTALLGKDGNVGIAGHRDSFFRGLKDIKIGERIELEESDRTEIYIVDRVQIVTPENTSVLRYGDKPTLTLVTCYPFHYIGKAPQRFIVHASLMGNPGLGVIPATEKGL